MLHEVLSSVTTWATTEVRRPVAGSRRCAMSRGSAGRSSPTRSGVHPTLVATSAPASSPTCPSRCVSRRRLRAPVDDISPSPLPPRRTPMNLEKRWAGSRAQPPHRGGRLMADTHYDWLRTRQARVALVVAYAPPRPRRGGLPRGRLDRGHPRRHPGDRRVGAPPTVGATIADLPGTTWTSGRPHYATRRTSRPTSGSAVRRLPGQCGPRRVHRPRPGPDTWSLSITWDAAMAIFWVVLGLVLALPSMVLALRARI